MQVVCLVSTCTPMAGPTGQNSQLVARLRSEMKLPSPSSAQRYLLHLWSVCAVLDSQCLQYNNFCRLVANLCKIVLRGASKGSTQAWVCRGTTGLKWLARLPCHAMSTSAKSLFLGVFLSISLSVFSVFLCQEFQESFLSIRLSQR